jgi:hypothetical protein
MRITFFILLITVKIYGQPSIGTERVDRNTLNVYAGMAISAGIGAKIYSKTKMPLLSSAIGFASGCFVGLGKEAIYDKMLKRGVCDNADAYKTFWGAAVGAMCIRIVIDIKEKHDLQKEYFQHLGDSLRLYKVEPTPITSNK